MDKELKNEKPKRFRPLIRTQVVNLLSKSERDKMSAEQLKRWILDHSCDNCFKPFKYKVSKQFHECKINRAELKRIPMIDIKSSKFRDSSKVEAIESDGNLDASDSESDIGEAEKEMKKYIKDSDSDLSYGSHEESDEADKICGSCKEDLGNVIETKVKDDGTDIIEIQGTYMLDDYSICCESSHLCRVDTNLIDKGVELFLSGAATCHDTSINLKRAGPITSWYLQYLDGSWWYCVCFEQSAFLLKDPNEEYSKLMELSKKKLKLFSLASKYFGYLEEDLVKDKFSVFLDFLRNNLDESDEDEDEEITKDIDIEKLLKENSSFLYKHLRETTEKYRIKFINTEISSFLKKRRLKRKRRRRTTKKTVDLNSSIQSVVYTSSDSEEVMIIEEEEINMEEEIQILGTFSISNEEETRTILELKPDSEAHVQSPYAQRDESPIPGTSHQIDEPHFNTAQDDDIVEEIKPEPEMSDDGYDDIRDSSSDEVEILENDAEEPENSDDDEIKIIPQEIN